MTKIILATKNKGKVAELQGLLAPLDIEILSSADVGVTQEIEETGTTFLENAMIKAKTVCELTNLPAIADDSGLCVDALDGAPSVFSARYAGECASDKDNNQKLLRELQGVSTENRRAYFACAIALFLPDGRHITSEGICNGYILENPKGEGGFGYDPLFYCPEFDKTFAEIPIKIKNEISHRAIAVQKFVEKLKKEEYRTL